MNNGYILLWRKSLNSMVWKDRKLWRLWSYILMSARWRAGRDLLGRKPVDLAPGELLATLEGLAQATGLSLKEVRSALALAVRVGVVSTAPTAWGTRIAIVNWQEYQGPEAASGKKKAPRHANPPGNPQPAQQLDPDKTVGKPSGTPPGMPTGKRGARAGHAQGHTEGLPSPTVKQGTTETGQAPAPLPPDAKAREAGAGGFPRCADTKDGKTDDDCQRFLDAYPKKASQQAARAIFAELRQSGELPGLELLLCALARHCAQPAWAAEGGRFIPTPANWLARRSWTGLATGPAQGSSAIDQWLRAQEDGS